MLAEAHWVPERGGQWGDEVFVMVLRSVTARAITIYMEPVRAKEEGRSAATRVYEQWHGESLSCRIPYERGEWRWFVLGQGRRGPAPLCGPCAHMSRAPLLSLRGCGPRSPSSVCSVLGTR